jgi:hypothetical protein
MISIRVLRHFSCRQWKQPDMLEGRIALNSTKKISSAHLRLSACRLVGNVDHLRFRDVSEVKIRRITMESYCGGGNVRDTSPKNQRLYIDNYVVSTKPIGCFAARRLAKDS